MKNEHKPVIGITARVEKDQMYSLDPAESVPRTRVWDPNPGVGGGGPRFVACGQQFCVADTTLRCLVSE